MSRVNEWSEENNNFYIQSFLISLILCRISELFCVIYFFSEFFNSNDEFSVVVAERKRDLIENVNHHLSHSVGSDRRDEENFPTLKCFALAFAGALKIS